jgi:ABC-type nitrate/sulfonate/bicarbonate transport system substrate-binding protein
VPEHFNLPWHLAIESSEAARCGQPVAWADYAAGTGPMLADLAAGSLDLAVLLTEGAARGLALGLPIVAVSLYTTSPLIWGVHVPPRSRFERIADLRGARFAISREGSGSHLMSFALAAEQGWPAAGLEFEIVDDLPGAIEAFRQGRADAFLWEHFTTEPAVSAGHFRRIDDFVGPWPAWVICASRPAWDRHRVAIESLIAIVAATADRLATAPHSIALFAERYELEPQAIEQWLARTHWVKEHTSPQSALATAERMLRKANAL